MRYLSMVILALLIPFGATSQTAHRQTKTGPAKVDPASVTMRIDAVAAVDQVIDQLDEIEDLGARAALAEKIVRVVGKSRSDRLRKMVKGLFDETMNLRSAPAKAKSPDLDSITYKIIQTAAVIDLDLASGFIEVLSQTAASTTEAKNSSNRSLIYARIARQLSRSNTALAVEVATRSLADGIVPDTLLFLATLRELNVSAANRFFLSALQSWQAKGGKDVNELLLLYSYVFSPLRIPTVVSQGIVTLTISGYSELARSYEVDAALARQYLQVLKQTLLDPLRYTAGNIETLTLGAAGDFYALSIIEPWAAAFDSADASAFSARGNLVLSYMQASQRETAFSTASHWEDSTRNLNSVSGGIESRLQNLVEKAETTADSKRKDQLYFHAALEAVRLKRYATALTIVEKISVDYSEKAKQFIRFDIALQEIQDQKIFEAEKLARMDDVLVRRGYILTVVADNLTQGPQKDPSGALRYFYEVQQLADRLSDNREKLSTLIAVGNGYARLDTARASEILREIIKQANKMGDFVGDSSISNVLEINGFYFDYSLYATELTFFDLIKQLATVSYYATLQDLRSLKNRTLRLNAIIALCSAVIFDQNPAVTVSR